MFPKGANYWQRTLLKYSCTSNRSQSSLQAALPSLHTAARWHFLGQAATRFSGDGEVTDPNVFLETYEYEYKLSPKKLKPLKSQSCVFSATSLTQLVDDLLRHILGSTWASTAASTTLPASTSCGRLLSGLPAPSH